MQVYEQSKRFLKSGFAASLTFILLLLICPVLMAFQNWDDHDRSGRYTARDIGANYLESCAPNSILFTYGDNDSFPVWYVQDVEGIRTDIRVANLSYIQAGWYIDMMRQKAFESDPLPFSLKSEKYLEGVRGQLPVNNRVETAVKLDEIVQFATLDDKKYMIDYSGRGDYLNYLPANKFLIDVDSSVVLSNGTVKEYYKDRLISPMLWEYTETDAFKGDLAIMDLLVTNKWERPVYFSTTVPATQYKGLEKFFVQEGMAYRIVPIKTDESPSREYGMIDPHVMYDNMMNKFKWGNAADPDVYLDENNRRMFSNFRRIFGSLGESLLLNGDTTKAIAVVHRGLEIVPKEKLPYDFFAVPLAEVLLKAGAREEAEKLFGEIINYSKGYLEYAASLKPGNTFDLDYPVGINYQALYEIAYIADRLNEEALLNEVGPLLDLYTKKFYPGK
jgi:hypothetical protein